MGTSNSKHDARAAEYPALPAVYQGDNEAQQHSLLPFKQAPVTSVVPCGNSFIGDPSAFPTELPERPARHLRFSLRKSSKALPASPASVSVISIPSPPPSSTSSTTFGPGSPSRITPPSSPPSRFRKPFRFDAVPVNIKKSLSTSDLSTPVNFSRPSRKSRAESSHLNPLALQPPGEIAQRRDTELSPFGSDGLARGLSRLHVSRPNPFTPTESSGREQSSSSTSSPLAPTEGNSGLHPIEENTTMRVLRIPRQALPRERSEPYLDPERRNDRRQSRRSQSQQILNPFARNSRARQGSLPTYNDFFPDDSQAISISRDGMLESVPTSTPSPSGENRARAQEEADRALAAQLQREEDGEYDFYYGLEGATPRPPCTRNPSTFVRSRGPTFQAPNTGEPSATLGSRDNPIDLDSDDDAWYDLPDDALMEGSDFPPEYDRVQQEDTDAQIAQQLHEEEEERVRRERSPSTRDCVVCGDSTPVPEFPALVECNHQPEICRDCFKGWIASELESKSWDTIKCPGSKCKVIMQHNHVQQYADPDIYAKFDALSARSALNDDPNFRWCRGPNCQSGQIHVSGEEGNIFRCVACGFRVCVIHEDTWHEGETCEEYDYRRSGKKERDQKLQEEASVKAIGELTKRCPGKRCNWPIEKNEGCDHMTCSKCRFEFCWICLAPYGPIRNRGNSAHKKSCKYHSSNIA